MKEESWSKIPDYPSEDPNPSLVISDPEHCMSNSVSEPDPDPELFAGSGSVILISDPEPERIRNSIFAYKLNFLLNKNVYLCWK